jgi:hypothetical protein
MTVMSVEWASKSRNIFMEISMNEDFTKALDASDNYERSLKVALMERILATPRWGVQPGTNNLDAYNESIKKAQSISLDYLANKISSWPTLLDKVGSNGPVAPIRTVDSILNESLGSDPGTFDKRRDILAKASEFVSRSDDAGLAFIVHDHVAFTEDNLRTMATRINSPMGKMSVLEFMEARETGSKKHLPNPLTVIRTKIPDDKIKDLVSALSDFQRQSEDAIGFLGTAFGDHIFYNNDPDIRTARFQPDAARPLIDRLKAELDNADIEPARPSAGFEPEQNASDESSASSAEQEATNSAKRQRVEGPVLHSTDTLGTEPTVVNTDRIDRDRTLGR